MRAAAHLPRLGSICVRIVFETRTSVFFQSDLDDRWCSEKPTTVRVRSSSRSSSSETDENHSQKSTEFQIRHCRRRRRVGRAAHDAHLPRSQPEKDTYRLRGWIVSRRNFKQQPKAPAPNGNHLMRGLPGTSALSCWGVSVVGKSRYETAALFRAR